MITAVQNQEVYILYFNYNPDIITLVKNVPGRKYVPEKKYWTIPLDRLGFLIAQLQGTPYEQQFRVISAEHINENTTMDASGTIPDIDLSKIPLYIKDGEHFFQHQLDFMKYAIDRQRRGIYSGFLLADQPGLGKAVSLDTKVYTPTGYKLMKDIQVGDYVFGKDGKPTLVRAVYDHHNVQMYRITFSDGATIDCCKDHLWEIHDQSGKKVVPTSWFMQKDQFGKIRKDHLWAGGKYKYWIDRCNPVEFEAQNVPIDPYLLGLLLGDGCIRYGVSIATPDVEILEYINQVLPDGLYLRKHNDDPYAYSISCGQAGGYNPILSALKALNLFGKSSHTKFIPDVYKYNSVEVRKAVLQGLLDTDAYCATGNCLVYTTVSPILAKDVTFLVESLGGLVHLHEKPCGYDGKVTGVAYDLTIKLDNPQEYVRLSRRKALLQSRKFRPRRCIIKIEAIANADAKCIAVDNAEHLYLIDHFVVTHNTLEAMNLALYNKRFNGIKHCLIITCVNSAKYNWVADIKKHTNGKYTPYLLGSRKKKRKEGIRLEGSSEEKLEDLLHGYMYNDDTCNPLPFFLIMNIEAIRFKKDRKYQIRDRLIKLINSGYIGMVILDECHKGISPGSSQGTCILEIKRKTANTKIEWLPMTGTPIVNKPTDLFTPLKLVDGHAYTNYKSWCENFCIYGGFGDRVLLGYKNMPQLKQMLQSSMLRRLKSEVLDLPPKIHIVEYVEDTPYQAQLYKTLVDETARKRDKILAAINPRAEFIRLRQISGSPELVDKSVVANKAYLSKNAKLTRLLDLVDTIVENDEKVIIFSNWVEPLRTVYRFLASKYEVCCYTGTMKAEVREEHKQRFRTDPNCRILIGTVGALGPSHNLPEASNVIFYDLPWNPATMEQAEDRAYRPETKQALTVYSLISRGTVDEVVYNIIMTKDGLSKYLVDNELDIKNNSKLFDLLIGAAIQNSEGSNENIL